MEWRAARLYLLFTPELCARDPWRTLEAALDGVQLVQWRVKEPDSKSLSRCIRICSERSVPVIVNDHVQMAVDHGACGAHVGQQDMPAEAARRILGEGCLGISTHSLEEVRGAVAAGADYLGFGPCFPTRTKGYGKGQPRGALAEAMARSPVPVFAIGGIGPENIDSVVAEGCRRVAVSSAILTAPEPRSVARQLLDALGQSSSMASPYE